MTVPPLGQQPSRFVDGSHPRGFLAASMRNVGSDQRDPTGYEVMAVSCCINRRKPVPALLDRGGTLRYAWLRAPPRSRSFRKPTKPLGRLTQEAPYEGGQPRPCAAWAKLPLAGCPRGWSSQAILPTLQLSQ